MTSFSIYVLPKPGPGTNLAALFGFAPSGKGAGSRHCFAGPRGKRPARCIEGLGPGCQKNLLTRLPPEKHELSYELRWANCFHKWALAENGTDPACFDDAVGEYRGPICTKLLGEHAELALRAGNTTAAERSLSAAVSYHFIWFWRAFGATKPSPAELS